jgi:hypothetical protein
VARVLMPSAGLLKIALSLLEKDLPGSMPSLSSSFDAKKSKRDQYKRIASLVSIFRDIALFYDIHVKMWT